METGVYRRAIIAVEMQIGAVIIGGHTKWSETN
jgi:hypothetical protein